MEKTDGDFVTDKNSLVYLSVGILVVFLLLVGGVYWYVSKKSKGEVVFPAGINYTGPGGQTQPTPMYDFAKMATSSDWVAYKGKTYSFTFQHPKALTAYSFPNDPLDAVTFRTSSVPPEQNLMLVVETISKRDPAVVGKYEEFVRNYWKYFPGLKSVKDVSLYQTEKGLKGYKVNYVNKANIVGTDNYFFMIPGDNDHMIHVNNTFPKEGDAVFMRMLNSLEYAK